MPNGIPQGHSPYTIDMFNYEWYFTNTVSFAGLFIFLTLSYFVLNSQYVKKNNLEIKITQLFGVLILSRFLISQIYQLYNGIWNPVHSLPFHLCGISGIAAGVLLIKYNQSLYEFVLLLGAPGALWSFLTPQFTLLESGAGFHQFIHPVLTVRVSPMLHPTQIEEVSENKNPLTKYKV